MIKKYLSDKIPTFFFNHTTGQPFEFCNACGEHLDGRKYIIEKVFKQNLLFNKAEIVYEYAICFKCSSSMQGEISDESMQNITNLFKEYQQNVMMKLDYLHSTEKYDIESWIESCSFTGKSTKICEEFTVTGIVEDNSLVFEQSPIVVSDQFLELVQESLSKSTKDAFDGLRDKILIDSPTIEDIINTPTIGIF